MGIYDRDYTHEPQRPQIRFTMPHITPVVKWLLIINGGVFLLTAVESPLSQLILRWFSVFPVNAISIFYQPWQYVTYQFLHANFSHIFFNMVVLFFFGPMLESQWGSRRFIRFYLIAGAAGGILYAVLVASSVLSYPADIGMDRGLVGASGAIYGLLAAAAVLYPSMRVYVFGIFPMPMAVVALMLVALNVLGILGGSTNASGQAAHLAGLAAGALMVIYGPWMSKLRMKKTKGAWQKKMEMQKDFHSEIDRILDKVHKQGIKSLTRKEKSILKRATELEQQ